MSVILANLFRRVHGFNKIPNGFRYSYIVPLPKPKDCRSKAMTCDDFRSIAISPIISKVFEYCLLDTFSVVFSTADNQFGFKKNVSCSHAIYAAINIIDKSVNDVL